MLDFKLRYYFEKYKETPVISTGNFKKKFITDNGEFALLNELIVMIQRYQVKKYGDLLASGKRTIVIVKKGTYTHNALARDYQRYGTLEDRKIRKIREAHN